MLSVFDLLLCVETDGVRHLVYFCVCGDRWCQHLVYCCVWRQMAHKNKPNV